MFLITVDNTFIKLYRLLKNNLIKISLPDTITTAGEIIYQMEVNIYNIIIFSNI